MRRVFGLVGRVWAIAFLHAAMLAVISVWDLPSRSGVASAAVSVFVANAAVNFFFLLPTAAVAWGLASLGRRFGRRAWEARRLGISYAGALLVYLTALLPVNVAFLPEARSILSVVGNIALLALTVPVAAGLYALISNLEKLLTRINKWRRLYGLTVVIVSVAAVAWFLAHASFSLAPRPPANEKYNLIIISIDTLRRDYVSCYGERAGTTPHIDRFAEKAIVFEESYSAAPWTTPSMMTMLSGQYPSVHNCRSGTAVSESVTLLAEVLRGYGYRTSAIVASIRSVLGPQMGFGRGFDSYKLYTAFPGSEALRESWLIKLITHVRSQDTAMDLGNTTPWVTDRALALLDKASRDRPLFIWVHYFDPHFPYTPPPAYLTAAGGVPGGAGRFLAADVWELDAYTVDKRDILEHLYRREVEYVDAQLGLIFEKLEREGFLANTVVVVTADHGEEFFEHAKWGHGGDTSTQGPSHNVEVVAVPLIIYVPGSTFKPGRVAKTNVSLIDLRPTLLEVLGLPPEPGAPGTSLVRFIKGAVEPDRAVFVDETCLDLTFKSVRRGKELLIRHGNPPEFELYHRKADPQERHNIAAEDPALRERLIAELGRWLKENEVAKLKFGPGREVEISEADRDVLRAMGYIK